MSAHTDLVPTHRRKPLIGLTGRRELGSILEVPRGFADAPLDVYMSEYAQSVAQAGGIPIHVSLDSLGAEVAERLDGIVIAGGHDVDPRRYGQTPHEDLQPIDPQRDQLELDLVAAAVEHDIPLLGICRGQQILNVALGGTLIQHLTGTIGGTHGTSAYPRTHRAHRVSITPGSTIAGLYGLGQMVNSFHHQAIDTVADRLRVTARAEDGVIESVEMPGKAILGVQWHPEVFGNDPVFGWLVEAASRTR